MAKILISGVAGFIGSHLADRLIRDRHQVVGIDNLLCGDVRNVYDCVYWSEADCALPPPHLFSGVDLVYHLAAVPYEGLSFFSPSLVVRNNVSATVAMATAAASAGVKRFIYTSSLSRYGYHDRLPFTEDTPCRPQSPYGISKVCAEDLLKVIGFQYNMEVVVAVLHNTIGVRQQYDNPYCNVVAQFINQMLQQKRPIIYGDGKQKRSFVGVGDVVEALTMIGFQDNIAGQTINIGNDNHPISINMLGRLVANIIGVPFNPMMVPGPPGEVVNAWLSVEKQRKLLGVEPVVKIEDAIALMIDEISLKGTKDFKYHRSLEIDSPRAPWKA